MMNYLDDVVRMIENGRVLLSTRDVMRPIRAPAVSPQFARTAAGQPEIMSVYG